MRTVQDIINELSNEKLNGLSLGYVDYKAALNEDIQQIAALIANHKQLSHISFDGNDLSSNDFALLRPVLSAIKNNSKIQRIYFAHSHLENASESNLDIVYDCIKVKENVTLCRNSISMSDIAGAFIAKLVTQSSIKSFDFQLNDIGKRGYLNMKVILESLAKSNLEYLSLSSNLIGGGHSCGKELINLFGANIKYINLSGNPLGLGILTEEWPALFNVINNNKNIERVVLCSCDLGDIVGDEPDEFSEGLLKFVETTHLKELDLSKNNFSKEFTMALLKAASKNPSLTFRCEDNGLSKKDIQSLQLEFAKIDLKLLADKPQDVPPKINGHSDSLIFSKNNHTSGNGHATSQETVNDTKPHSNGSKIQ